VLALGLFLQLVLGLEHDG